MKNFSFATGRLSRWGVVFSTLWVLGTPSQAQTVLDQPAPMILGNMQVWQARQEIDPVLSRCAKTSPEQLPALKLAAQHYLELAQDVQDAGWKFFDKSSERAQKVILAIKAKEIPAAYQQTLRFQILDVSQPSENMEKISDGDLCAMFVTKWQQLIRSQVRHQADQINAQFLDPLKVLMATMK